MPIGLTAFLCLLAAVIGWFTALTAIDEEWFGSPGCHAHDKKRSLSRRLVAYSAVSRSVGSVRAVYECSCGQAWETTENETAKEYEERMADLDIAADARKAKAAS